MGASGTWLFPSLEANLALAGFLFLTCLLTSDPSLPPDLSFSPLVSLSLCPISLLPSSRFSHFRVLFPPIYFCLANIFSLFLV